MSFRIHTSSPELKRELEKELAGLEGQLDGDFDYEISAEVLPAEQALDRARVLAVEVGADSIFVAAGAFAKKEAEIPEPVHVEPLANEAKPQVVPAPIQISNQRRSEARFDWEKFRQTFTEKSGRVRELSAKLASQTGSFMKSAGSA